MSFEEADRLRESASMPTDVMRPWPLIDRSTGRTVLGAAMLVPAVATFSKAGRLRGDDLKLDDLEILEVFENLAFPHRFKHPQTGASEQMFYNGQMQLINQGRVGFGPAPDLSIRTDGDDSEGPANAG